MNPTANQSTQPAMLPRSLLSGVPLASRIFLNLLAQLKSGNLRLITPEGVELIFGNSLHPLSVTVKIGDWRACQRILYAGDIGLAESVEAGWIDTSDMTALLRLAIRNQATLNRLIQGNRWVTCLYRLRHWLRPNTRKGSRRNIHAHYDIGNKFYQCWLDPSMTYSSALFNGDYSLSLQHAQDMKYQRIIDQLGLSAGHQVLEIGCGWGGFAEFAAKQGIKVTGITISQSQLDYAQERMRRASLSENVNLSLCDYRDVAGIYDGIVSIEMFEAVGERFWSTYFKKIAACLRPNAKALVQSITISERDFEQYRTGTDFIQQYIFPGGMLPSPERFVLGAAKAGLQTQQQFMFGADYAETLRRWRTTWEHGYENILKQGFDEKFMRIWGLYFSYCEAGFAEGKTDVGQFLLAKA